MEIIPAIDIRGGQCVRLLQGNDEHETVYDTDPLAVAQRRQEQGATRLHITDRDGESANFDLIAAITNSLSIPVQVGGGLRSADSVEALLEAGVERCVIGPRAVAEPQWAQQMFMQFGDTVILGLDIREGFAMSGRTEANPIPAVHFAQTMQDFGCHRILLTDIVRDGTLAGPDAPALRHIAEAVEIPVVVRGGVHKATDVRILKHIPHIEGAIVGRALYESTVSISQLNRIAAEREEAVAASITS